MSRPPPAPPDHVDAGAARPGSELGTVWFLLAGVAVVGATALLGIDHARSWHYFAEAARTLVAGGDDGGLALYRSHPEYQFGPLAVLVSLPFAALPTSVGPWAVMVTGSLAGVVAFGCVVDTARSLHPTADPGAVRRVALVAGVPFVLLWLRLAAYTAHVDDVVILVLVPAGCAALARRRAGWAAVALAAAAATKPWAVVFVPVLLAAGGRRGLALALGAGAAASLTWAPFLLGAPGTLDALRSFGIDVTPNSGLRALGLTASATPGWVRPVQLLGGLAVTTAVVLRGAWTAAPAAGVAVRLLLDPATHHYYSVGFLVAGLLWELSRDPTRLPWRTAAVMGVLWIAAGDVNVGGLVAPARFALLALVIVVALAAPGGHGPAAARVRSPR